MRDSSLEGSGDAPLSGSRLRGAEGRRGRVAVEPARATPGRRGAPRAAGFELRVLYTQRTRVDSELAEHRELDELLAESDVVTIHAPLTAETRGMIDARCLARLRVGASLVNTSRGEIVDEPALVAELVSGRLRAGLDVFAHEPHVPEELLSLPNGVLTPHLGSG